MRRPASWFAGCVILGSAFIRGEPALAAGADHVVELFTSLGCSSCPPADEFAGRLRALPNFIVLSFHVRYWDSAAFRDPFGSQASTDRQYAYVKALNVRTAFTPQLIVNGSRSVVLSDRDAVSSALESKSDPWPVTVQLSRGADGALEVLLQGPAVPADVWEVDYVSKAVTRIRGGENGGRTLATYNNVTRIHRLGAFAPGTLHLPAPKSADDGVAVIVQAPGPGRILGAGAYPLGG